MVLTNLRRCADVDIDVICGALQLRSNQITDIAPLKHLTSLRSLDVSETIVLMNRTRCCDRSIDVSVLFCSWIAIRSPILLR
jgi:hypothetical protein